MTKQEFNAAFRLAGERRDIPFTCDCLCGFGLMSFNGGQAKAVSLAALADLIRWQTFYIDGSGVDQDALDEIWRHRRKFIVVGDS